eukprot:36509-Pleurochrysis_carterae.AAC.1
MMVCLSRGRCGVARLRWGSCGLQNHPRGRASILCWPAVVVPKRRQRRWRSWIIPGKIGCILKACIWCWPLAANKEFHARHLLKQSRMRMGTVAVGERKVAQVLKGSVRSSSRSKRLERTSETKKGGREGKERKIGRVRG